MTATPPRPASTVVVLRPSPARFDVLLVRRHDAVAFMGGAHVFPGGRVDDADDAPTLARRHELAAVRELREEAGIELAPEDLIAFAHWVTPAIEIKRYDTWFFLAVVGAGQQATHDGVENTESLWIDPAEAIARCARGEILLPPPTWITLRELSRFAGHEEALMWAGACRIERIDPEFEERDGVKRLTVPGAPPTRFVMKKGRWVVVGA